MKKYQLALPRTIIFHLGRRIFDLAKIIKVFSKGVEMVGFGGPRKFFLDVRDACLFFLCDR